MKRKTFIFIISIIMIFTFSGLFPAATAASLDNAETGVYSEPGVVAAEYDISGTTLERNEVLPRSYSSRALGYTTGVRRQSGQDCWTFGSLATLETFTLKKNATYEQKYAGEWLSPLHMNYWGTSHNLDYGWQRTLTQGGYPYISMGYLMSWQGSVLESDYPYISGDTYLEDFTGYDKQPRVQIAATSIIYLDPKDRYTIKKAIYDYGAVTGNYNHRGNYYNPDTYAYYFNQTGLPISSLSGHCISVVGWDDDFSKYNFLNNSTIINNGAWLCKNSYGSDWGDNGFFWISYEDTYLFSDNFGYSYALTSTRQMTSITKMYQNEIYGSIFDFDINTDHIARSGKTYDSITYANVYNFEDGFNRIEDIIIESASIGTKYELYDIPLDNNVPSSDESTWNYIAGTTSEYTGYVRINCNDYMIEDGRRAIGVKVYKNTDGTLKLGCDEWLKSGGRFLFIPNTQKGQSYIIGTENGTVDLLDYYSENLELDDQPDTIGSTFVIKVVASQKHNFGCVHKDNKMSISDATLIQEYAAKLVDFDSEQHYLADVNYDGSVDISDATVIQQMLAKIVPIPNVI